MENFAAQISKFFQVGSLKSLGIKELAQTGAFLKTFLIRNIPTLGFIAYYFEFSGSFFKLARSFTPARSSAAIAHF